MSNNPQWKDFQPPIMNSDPAILDYKSLAIPTKKVVSACQQSANSYRNGTNYTGDHYIMDSDSEIYTGGITSPRNGGTRFNTSRTVASMEGSVTSYTADSTTNTNNLSSYQDQSNNQGPREAGIIEKLLVNTIFFVCWNSFCF